MPPIRETTLLQKRLPTLIQLQKENIMQNQVRDTKLRLLKAVHEAETLRAKMLVDQFRQASLFAAPTVDVGHNPVHRIARNAALKYDNTYYHREFAAIRCDYNSNDAAKVEQAAKEHSEMIAQFQKSKSAAIDDRNALANNRHQHAMHELAMKKVIVS
jgi:hypothetical protein